MAATTEELSDCRYQWEQDKAEAAAQQRALQQDKAQLENSAREMREAKGKVDQEVGGPVRHEGRGACRCSTGLLLALLGADVGLAATVCMTRWRMHSRTP
jgi:hypothetical protein